MIRRYIPAAAAALLMASAAAAEPIAVRVNGAPAEYAGAQEVQGRVLVPLRGVLDEMGATVRWHPNSRSVEAVLGSRDIRLPLGSDTAQVNGRDVPLDVPARAIRGRTMVPLRFISKALGADVSWNATTETVSIWTHHGPSAENAVAPEPSSPSRMPAVTSVSDNLVDAVVRAGQTVRVTAFGTPGGRAWFRIRGVVGEVPMREVSPGVYKGAWVCHRPYDTQVRNKDVLVGLTVGDRASPETGAYGSTRQRIG